MVIKKAELDIVLGVTSAMRTTGEPEFVFAGRSNVGKSSLINALLNRKKLARCSSEPGKTRTINFYHINDAFYLVDLPGYGYAKVSQKMKEKWGKMIDNYLRSSATIKAAFLLVDIRHEPTANDRLMYDRMKNTGFEPVVIANKLDKIKRSQINASLSRIRKTLGMKSEDRLIAFSAETKQGRDQIWQEIEAGLEIRSDD